MGGLGFQQQLTVERMLQNGFQARIADHEDPTEVSRESFRLISEHGMPRKIYLATLVRFGLHEAGSNQAEADGLEDRRLAGGYIELGLHVLEVKITVSREREGMAAMTGVLMKWTTTPIAACIL